MSQSHAAGRKTEDPNRSRTQNGMLERHIDDQLAVMTEAMRECLGHAKELASLDDQYGHRRASEFGNAVSLSKSSAKLLLALAKIRGQFNHNINVTRAGSAKMPEPRIYPEDLGFDCEIEEPAKEEKLFTLAEIDALSPEAFRAEYARRKAAAAARKAEEGRTGDAEGPPSDI